VKKNKALIEKMKKHRENPGDYSAPEFEDFPKEVGEDGQLWVGVPGLESPDEWGREIVSNLTFSPGGSGRT